MTRFGIDYNTKLAPGDNQFVNITKMVKAGDNKPNNYQHVQNMKSRKDDLKIKPQEIHDKVDRMTRIEDGDQLHELATVQDQLREEIKSLSNEIAKRMEEINPIMTTIKDTIQARDYWKTSKDGSGTSTHSNQLLSMYDAIKCEKKNC